MTMGLSTPIKSGYTKKKMSDIIHRLQLVSKRLADDGLADLQRHVEEAIEQLNTYSKGLQAYERERQRYRHAHPDISGAFFLTGGYGDKDDNELPEFVTICPAYGCAWDQVYQKTDRSITYEGS